MDADAPLCGGRPLLLGVAAVVIVAFLQPLSGIPLPAAAAAAAAPVNDAALLTALSSRWGRTFAYGTVLWDAARASGGGSGGSPSLSSSSCSSCSPPSLTLPHGARFLTVYTEAHNRLVVQMLNTLEHNLHPCPSAERESGVRGPSPVALLRVSPVRECSQVVAAAADGATSTCEAPQHCPHYWVTAKHPAGLSLSAVKDTTLFWDGARAVNGFFSNVSIPEPTEKPYCYCSFASHHRSGDRCGDAGARALLAVDTAGAWRFVRPGDLQGAFLVEYEGPPTPPAALAEASEGYDEGGEWGGHPFGARVMDPASPLDKTSPPAVVAVPSLNFLSSVPAALASALLLLLVFFALLAMYGGSYRVRDERIAEYKRQARRNGGGDNAAITGLQRGRRGSGGSHAVPVESRRIARTKKRGRGKRGPRAGEAEHQRVHEALPRLPVIPLSSNEAVRPVKRKARAVAAANRALEDSSDSERSESLSGSTFGFDSSPAPDDSSLNASLSISDLAAVESAKLLNGADNRGYSAGANYSRTVIASAARPGVALVAPPSPTKNYSVLNYAPCEARQVDYSSFAPAATTGAFSFSAEEALSAQPFFNLVIPSMVNMYYPTAVTPTHNNYGGGGGGGEDQRQLASTNSDSQTESVSILRRESSFRLPKDNNNNNSNNTSMTSLHRDHRPLQTPRRTSVSFQVDDDVPQPHSQPQSRPRKPSASYPI